MKEYTVGIFKEGLAGSLIVGGYYVKAEKFQEFLNEHAADGWEFVSFHRETRRVLLFFSREAFIVIFERNS